MYRIHTSRYFASPLLAIAAVALLSSAALVFAGCADDGYDTSDGQGTVSLAMTGDLAGAASYEITFTAEGDDAPTLTDTYQDNGSGGARNYRLDPGTYAVSVVVMDDAGEVILQGSATVDVAAGDNFVEVLLTDPAEDLSDLKISFTVPAYEIGTVSGDASAPEGGVANYTLNVVPTGQGQEGGDLAVFATLSFTDNNEEEIAFQDVVFEGSADATTWTAAVPVDFPGPATVTFELYENGNLADSTSKTVVGQPSEATNGILAQIEAQLVQGATDGQLKHLQGPIQHDAIEVTEAGIEYANMAIDTLNDTYADAGLSITPELALSLAPTVFYASFISWGCAWKLAKCVAAIAKCAACIAACVETAGLACLVCLATSCPSAYTKCKKYADDCL